MTKETSIKLFESKKIRVHRDTDIEKIMEVKFDYPLTQEPFKLYSSIYIPKIENKDIPKEVSNVTFKSNLLNSKSIDA